MRSRYNIMKESLITNDSGVNYPDVLSYPFNKFVFDYPTKEVIVTQIIKERFYLVCYENYGISEYDDIVLWLNNKSSVHELSIGEILQIPDRRDIENFLVINRIKRKNK